MKILIIQTAFLGDVVLTLPLAQAVRRVYPDSTIHMMVIPAASGIVDGSPVIDRTIIFDKKGKDRDVLRLFGLGASLRDERYDLVFSPHRSLRTAVLSLLTRARKRIGFSTSALRWAFTDVVPFPAALHEADRNLSLLRGIGEEPPDKEIPAIHPSPNDILVVDSFLQKTSASGKRLIAIAPGSVWFTKRWPAERYAKLMQELTSDTSVACVLIGGAEDTMLADDILRRTGKDGSVSAVGHLNLVQSAELIRRSDVLVTNDSAPMHLGVAMQTHVVALFGPTIPAFGFAPYGAHDLVIQRHDLECRPCTKHGGARCPIDTFECMTSISPDHVAAAVRQRLHPQDD